MSDRKTLPALLYIDANKDVPRGVMSSTARRGDKWFNLVEPGDIVPLQVTGGAMFGEAVVVKKELVSYDWVLKTALDNHVAQDEATQGNGYIAAAKLEKALKAAYGDDLRPNEMFTKLHIIPLNG